MNIPGKIERVATLESYRGKHYGQAGIIEAGKLDARKRCDKKSISIPEKRHLDSMKSSAIPQNFSQVSGSGEFECVMTEKELA